MNDAERISRLEAEVAFLRQRTGPGGLTVGPGLKLSQAGINMRLELVPASVGTAATASTSTISVSSLPALPPRNTYVLVCTNGKLVWMQVQEFACPV